MIIVIIIIIVIVTIIAISDHANSEGIQGKIKPEMKPQNVIGNESGLTKCYLLHLYRNQRFPDLTRQQLTLIQRLK